jgi:AcrR family transcriptional regulator
MMSPSAREPDEDVVESVPQDVRDSQKDSRARAARTKRVRTRSALIAAADTAFATQSWASTRVEDIADAAGVSVATAYNHFPTKHALVGAVFAPYMAGLVTRAEHDIAARRPVVDALSDQIHALARLSWTHRGLMAAYTAALFEYTIRVGGLPDPDDDADPRNIAPLLEVVLLLVQHGQATGELRRHPPAAEISGVIVNLLMMRCINRPDEPPDETADLLEIILLGALCPERLIGDAQAQA